MKSRQTSHFLLFLLTFLFFGNVNAQCPVTAFASKSTVVCGEPVALTAVAEGCKPLNNNFNNGNIGNDWKATTGAVVNNGTGTYSCVGPPPEGANQLWMGATVAAPREVATNVYDLTQCAAVGGSICFWMKYGRQGAPSPCEGIDLPAEGVSLQYKTATGAWTTIRYWDPNGGNDANLTSWKRYCINIPAAAMTTATEFRWRQEESSGAGFDTWGLDDVVITLSAPGYTYDWAHDAPQGPLATPTTPDVQPTTNTTYTVTYTNGIETCNSSVTVNVLLPSVTASASKILVCEGTQVQLDAVSSLIAVAPTACGITTYSGCPPNSVAGEPQIGNGNIVNSNNSITNNTFGDFSDNNMRTQILYRAAELTAQGFSAGQIANIQFDIASILTGGAYSSFRIQIGCTSQNAFTNNASSFVGGLTQVYGPTTISLTPGWNTFFFDKSFNWDGTSNIVVQICWTTNSSNDREAYTRDHTTNFISCVQGVENNNTGANVCTSSTFFSEESQRPNTRFGTCVPNTTPIEYSWTPAANLNNSDIQNPIATVNATTTYTVTALQQGYPAGCAATNTVTVSAYKPVITVNPNPANICPPGTNSVVLNGSGTTNTTIPATRTFTNGSAVAIPDAGGAITATCGTPGATQSSVIAVTAINPATLAANMVLEVAVNMTSANNGDYRIELVAPNGSVIALKLQQTANGANMTNTRFRAMGPAMANGGAPYNNVYGSADPFTNLTGNINGNWTLRITDYCKPLGTGTSTGTLTNWSITFNTQNYVATWLWTPATNLSSTTTPTTTASPTTSSPYTLTGTDFNGCSASVTVPVNVNTAPSIPVNSETICAGSSATLTATPFDGGGGTYSWSPGGATTQSITVSPASTTGYTVTYSSGGCTGTGNGTVTVNPTPTVTITNPTPTVCAGTAATLTANVSQAGGTYSWMPGGATTASITVTPATTTTYTCTYTLNGCVGTQTATVTVNPSPTVTVNNQTICNGASTTLTATPTPDATGTFSWSPGGATTQTITVSPTSTTTYTVTYTRAGCSATASGTVTVNPVPTVTVNNPTICSGASATITSTVTPTPVAGSTYSWAPGGQTTPNITVSPATTTNYTLTFTSAAGCSRTATSTVTVNPGSGVTVNDATICNGSSTTLTATPTTGGGTYLWSPGGQTTNAITVSPTSTVNYTVTYTLTGCSASDVATVTVNPVPTVTLANANICAGGSTTLTPTVNPTGGTYLWTPGGATSPTLTVSPTTTTNYTVDYTLNGCSRSATNTVTVAPALSAVISGGGTICANQTATVTINFSGSGPYNVVMNDGTQNINLNNISANPYNFTTSTAGTYTLVSVSNSSCTGSTSGSATVVVNGLVSVTNQTGSCDGMGNYIITFTISGGDRPTYNVSGMNGGNITGAGPNYTFTSNPIVETSPNYTFTVNDGNACNTINVTGNQTCGCGASATISGGGSACAGNSVDLNFNMTGTGPYDVDYTDGTTVFSLFGINSPHVVPVTASGNYTLVSVEDGTGCIGSTNGSATVTINPNPTVSVTLTGTNPICLGESATFNATPSQGGGTYSWYNGSTANSITITPTAAGTENVFVTYTLNGCGGTDGYTLDINDLPTVVSNDTTICSGGMANLIANGLPTGGTFVWQPVNVTGSTINVSPTTNTDYQVTYTLNGCSDDHISTVTVRPQPTVSFASTTICESESSTLTSNVDIPGGTYLWSPGGQTTSAITVSPGVGVNNYTVDYTLSGCTANASGTVTVNETPIVSVIDDEICNGEQAILPATVSVPGGTYTWGPGTFPNNDTLYVSPTFTSNYTLDYTVNGCTGGTTGEVIVNPSPTLTINNATICNGETATLTSSTSNPGGTYIWTPGGATTSAITVSPTVTTTYSLDYTLSGCTVTETATVTVNNASPITVNDSTICQGSAATLTATPVTAGGTYMWSPGGATTQAITVSPNSQTNYTVQYNLNNCLSTGTGMVTVNPVPTVNIPEDTIEVCEGSPATLTANPSLAGGTYSWTTPPASGQTTQSITVTPASTTEYFVNYVLNGCAAIDSSVVKVNLPPTLTVADDNICQGEVGTLTAVTNGDASTVTWMPGPFTGASISVSPATTTQYTATISAKGCANSASAFVNVTPTPSITASNTGPYCEGATIQLSAQTDATGPGVTFDWNGPTGFAASGQNVSRPGSTFADAGTYQVIVTNNNCTNIGFTDVEIIQPNQTVITPAGPFCADDNPVNLVVNFGGGSWFGPGVTDSDAGTFDPSQANEGTNTITYNPAPGECQTTGSTQILVNALPVVDFNTMTPSGCVPFATSFIDQTTPASASVSWNFGNGSTSTQMGTAGSLYPNSGMYSITLTSTSPDGCVNSLTKTNYVQAFDNAIANFDYTPSEISNLNPQVQFFNTSSNADQYEWTFSDGSQSFDENPSYNFGDVTGEQLITLVANNAGNCPDTITRGIVIKEELVYYIPNSFTPDGDKFNQTFQPVFTSGFDPYNFQMQIFNRWGELLYVTLDHTLGWDGSFQDKLVKEGVYMYKIQFKDKKTDNKTEKQGTVILVR